MAVDGGNATLERGEGRFSHAICGTSSTFVIVPSFIKAIPELPRLLWRIGSQDSASQPLLIGLKPS
jgi:hypothetical protein